jgi:hypothetical protein
MSGLPQAAIDAAMDTIERLGAGGSRTTVRIVLEAAAPLIKAAERDRIAQLADEAARDALAQRGPSQEPAESIRQDSWAKALTWFAMECRSGSPDARAREIAQRAEEIHAEHHPGYIVPSLDSCPEHTRAEYEALVADLLTGAKGDTP